MKLLRLAWRNVLRNLRRSLITVTAITVGLAALLFIWAFIDGTNEQMIENSTSYLWGHLKVHKKGYHEEKELHQAMTDDVSLRTAVARTENIQALTSRVEGKAMISGKDKSRGVLVVGVDPTSEVNVTSLNKSVIKGRYLQPDDDEGVLLGDTIAETLGLSLGDETVLVTQAADGSVGAGRYSVIGIFNTGMDNLDGVHVFLSLAAARDLYSLWGQATAWVVRLDQRKQAEAVAELIAGKLGPEFEVLGWEQLLSSVVQMVAFHDAMFYIVLIIVYVVVAVGIANTILMAVMERTREFGVMMALGTSRPQIVGLVILESLILGVIGLIIGNIMGFAINLFFMEQGLNLGLYAEAMATMPGLSPIVYPVIIWEHVLVVSALVFFISIVPALYPAWRAAGFEPVEAIRGTGSRKSKAHSPKTIKPGQRTRAVFWAIATRGVLRNPRRAMLTASATAIGLAAFIILYAIAEGWFVQMVENSTRFFSAHMQVERKGFRLDMEPRLNIENVDTMLRYIESDSRIKAVSPRVQARTMISTPVRTEPMLLLGIDPVREQQVTQIQDVITEGTYLQAAKGNNIVLGQRMARKLNVRLGEKVVVTVQQANGDLGSAAYRVTGIFTTGNEYFDLLLGFVPLDAGQALLGIGDNVSTIAVSLHDRYQSAATAQTLNTRLEANDYEALSWETIMPVVLQMIGMTKLFFYIVLGVVLFVIAMGIMNTLLMSVLERTREFGVMMAVGTEPGHLLRIVLYESLVLSSSGIVVGTILGIVITLALAGHGLDLRGFMDATETFPGMTAIITPVLVFENIWWPAVILFITGVVTAIYPARRAAQLEPVEAIRHV